MLLYNKKEEIIILRCINEVKLILDNNNLFRKQPLDTETEYMVMTLDDAYKAISFINNHLNENTNFVSFSLISNDPFAQYEDLILPIVKYIKALPKAFGIIIYTDGLNGTEEQYAELKGFGAKLKIEIDMAKEHYNIPEERMNLILKYFPLSRFNIHVTAENPDFISTWEYYKNFNLFEYNVDFDPNGNYTDEQFAMFEESLNVIDQYIVNEFESYNIPVLPEMYRYMLWKIGVRDYFIRNGYYRQIPEGMNGVCCGQGCNKQLIIDYTKNIFSCAKVSFDAIDSNIFWIGSVDQDIIPERIEILLDKHFEESLTPGTYRAAKIVENCKNCPLDCVCTCGCIPLNYIATEKFLLPSKYFCRWNKLFYEHALNLVNYFDSYQTNELFKDFYLGSLKKGENYVC